MPLKTCTMCWIEKPLEAFYRHNGARDGRQTRCACCFKKILRATAADEKVKNRQYRAAALQYLGGKCVHCGFADPRALQIDHIHGGGRQDIRKNGHGWRFYRRVISTPDGTYQLLCANCNWIKRTESPNEHPGSRPKTLSECENLSAYSTT